LLAIGVGGQMHGLVVLDAAGQPVRPAIVWSDTRSAGVCARWRKQFGDAAFSALAGLPIATGFLASSLAWLRAAEPERFARIRTVLPPKDELRRRLTGRTATDPSDAGGTLLFDVQAERWSRELLRWTGLSPAVLPPVLPSTSIGGTVTEAAASASGLPAGTPVVVGGADQPLSALALGLDDGLAAVSIGTGGTVLLPARASARPPASPAVHTLCHVLPGRRLRMGAILAAGGAFEWLRSTLSTPTGHPAAADDLDRAAGDVAPGADGLLFLPHLAGERTPLLDPDRSGAFLGLRTEHGLPHLVRAVEEGVVFALRAALEAALDGAPPPPQCSSPGAAAGARPGPASSPTCSRSRSRSPPPAITARSARPWWQQSRRALSPAAGRPGIGRTATSTRSGGSRCGRPRPCSTTGCSLSISARTTPLPRPHMRCAS
jgi:xylulokinase